MVSRHIQAGRYIWNTWQYRLFQTGLDVTMLVAAWYLTMEVRLILNPLMSLQFSREQMLGLAPPLPAILSLWVLVMPWFTMRKEGRDASPGAGLLRVAQSSLVSSTVLVVAAYFSRHLGVELSRSLVLLFFPVSFPLLLAGRYAGLLGATFAERRWASPERVAVLGDGQRARRFADLMQQRWNGSVVMVGVILPEGSSEEGLGDPVSVLGTTRQLGEVINRARLDRIIMLAERLSPEQAERCAQISRRMGVVLSQTIAAVEEGVRLRLTEIEGVPLLEWRPAAFTRKQELVKRVFDSLVAAATLVFLSPLLLVIAVLVKLTSPGPALYKSARVGKGGRHFTFLKFRTMHHRAPERGGLEHLNQHSGHLFKIRDDPRVTRLGRILRRYSLDELPQLVNVLRGEMSLVGPRPLPACDLAPDGQSREFGFWSAQRSQVLPGITGLWQIRGRSLTSFETMMELDVEYVRQWSLGLDLKILLETPFAVLSGRGAF